MKNYRNLLLLFLATFILSCAEDQDDTFASNEVVNEFIYRGMNAFYLYKPEIPVLDNDRFDNANDLADFTSSFSSPEDFFESLIFQRETVDRFSIVVSDYVALEQRLSGSRLSNGMEFGLVAVDGSATDIFGYVRYVQPDTDAATKGVTRGMIFNSIDGISLDRSNFRTLLAQDVYSIDLATLNNGNLSPTGNSINLVKSAFQENPILLSTVIDRGTNKVGYLVYNSFLRDFDNDLNEVFANFNAQGVTHLVLDLRYNGGGSVNTAIILGSLIAGEPTSQVFSTEEWNPEIQAQFLQQQPDRLINFFKNQTDNGAALNTLNLDKVHVITTGSSASASELVINALEPYVDVIQVGDDTAGKFQASITLYDSADYRRSGANPTHRYAMQPLILKSINANGVTDYINGLAPDIALREDFENLGMLGNPSEPLLEACLNDIDLNGRMPTGKSRYRYTELSGSNELRTLGTDMWRTLE